MSSALNKTQAYILRLAPKDPHMWQCYNSWRELGLLWNELRKKHPNAPELAENGNVNDARTREAWKSVRGKLPELLPGQVSTALE